MLSFLRATSGNWDTRQHLLALLAYFAATGTLPLHTTPSPGASVWSCLPNTVNDGNYAGRTRHRI